MLQFFTRLACILVAMYIGSGLGNTIYYIAGNHQLPALADLLRGLAPQNSIAMIAMAVILPLPWVFVAGVSAIAIAFAFVILPLSAWFLLPLCVASGFASFLSLVAWCTPTPSWANASVWVGYALLVVSTVAAVYLPRQFHLQPFDKLVPHFWIHGIHR